MREFESTTEFQESYSPTDLKKKIVTGGIGSLLRECGTPTLSTRFWGHLEGVGTLQY